MWEYPNFTNFEGMFTYPTIADPYVWLKILIGIFFIFSLTMFFSDKKLFGKGKLLSSMMVGSFFVTVLALFGSLVGFITAEILIYILVFFIVITAIFFFSSDKD